MTTSTTQKWVLALASVASLMVALDVLVVSTALSSIRVHLGASIEELGSQSARLYSSAASRSPSPRSGRSVAVA